MSALRKASLAATAAVIALALGAAPAFAWGGHGTATGGAQHRLRSGTAAQYVDTDGDGVCDNRGVNFVDADGDGVCDNRGTGAGFVDTDGDGVCDKYGTCGHHGRAGNDSGTGRRGGRF